MWKSAQAAPRTMRFLDPEGLVDDFAKAMARSVDMTTEAAALTRLRANFPPRTGVVFPEALAAQKGALVETYEPGLPLEDALKLLARADADTATAAKRNVAKRGLRALLQMLFKDNFAHGDMHAGNLLVRAPAGGGDALDARAFAARVAAGDFDLVVLDAGLVVELARCGARIIAFEISLERAASTGRGGAATCRRGYSVGDEPRRHCGRDVENWARLGTREQKLKGSDEERPLVEVAPRWRDRRPRRPRGTSGTSWTSLQRSCGATAARAASSSSHEHATTSATTSPPSATTSTDW